MTYIHREPPKLKMTPKDWRTLACIAVGAVLLCVYPPAAAVLLLLAAVLSTWR